MEIDQTERTLFKCLAWTLIFIVVGMTCACIADTVSNYYITIEAIENGYRQEHSNIDGVHQILWVKD